MSKSHLSKLTKAAKNHSQNKIGFQAGHRARHGSRTLPRATTNCLETVTLRKTVHQGRLGVLGRVAVSGTVILAVVAVLVALATIYQVGVWVLRPVESLLPDSNGAIIWIAQCRSSTMAGTSVLFHSTVCDVHDCETISDVVLLACIRGNTLDILEGQILTIGV